MQSLFTLKNQKIEQTKVNHKVSISLSASSSKNKSQSKNISDQEKLRFMEKFQLLILKDKVN